MPRKTTLAVAFALAAASSVAAADTVYFNNGDQITGKIKGVEGGRMTIDSKYAGEIKVDVADVKTFTTDAPVDIRTTAGQRISAKAAAGDAGSVNVVDPIVPGKGTPLAVRSVPVAQMKYVNFNESWTGAVVAGAMFSRGNTYTDQANVAFDVARRTEQDRWTIGAAYNFGRQRDPGTGDKATTTDNYWAAAKYDYFFTPKLYAFGTFRYEHDRIAALDYRMTPGVGVGYQWAERPTFTFNTEGGLSYVVEKYDDGENNDFIAARLAYHVKRQFSEKVAAFHDLEYFPSLERLDDFLIIADAGLRVGLTDKVFAEYKIEWRYDATPAEGASSSDLRHMVGLGWKF